MKNPKSPKRKKQHAALIRLFNILKKHLPLKHKVVYRTKRFHNCGECSFNERTKVLTLVIDNQAELQTQIDTMLHEYAHAIRMDQNSDNLDHGDDWGVEYSKVWNCFESRYLETLNNQKKDNVNANTCK
jgi:hypothetical protein